MTPPRPRTCHTYGTHLHRRWLSGNPPPTHGKKLSLARARRCTPTTAAATRRLLPCPSSSHRGGRHGWGWYPPHSHPIGRRAFPPAERRLPSETGRRRRRHRGGRLLGRGRPTRRPTATPAAPVPAVLLSRGGRASCSHTGTRGGGGVACSTTVRRWLRLGEGRGEGGAADMMASWWGQTGEWCGG